jgi:heat shock protein HslJ
MHGSRGRRVVPVPRVPLVLVLAAASAVVGCASNVPGVGVDDPGTTGSLAGRTFLSESVTEDGQPRPLVEGTRIELDFSEDGRVTASAGCNFASAPVEVERGRILVGDLATTEMGCARELHDQDEWLAGVLAADPAHVLHGSRLRLEADGVVIGLVDREVAQPDRPLELQPGQRRRRDRRVRDRGGRAADDAPGLRAAPLGGGGRGHHGPERQDRLPDRR